MNFQPQTFYHIYNQGNNKQEIFFKRDNYLHFLKKVRKELVENFEILAYCLMPNHFHFLVLTKLNINTENIIKKISSLLSSYTQAINKQENRSGNLFQRKTKAKAINSETNYLLYCINYIHQNPFKAKLVNNLEDWEYSSFRDYTGFRNGNLCNTSLGKNLLGCLSNKDFYKISYYNVDIKYIKSFY